MHNFQASRKENFDPMSSQDIQKQDVRSMKSDYQYQASAIGDFSIEELDRLKQANLDKIKAIEDKYF